MNLEAGTVIGGKFRLEKVLGYGGMAVVYLAQDLTLPRKVAIKCIRREILNEEQAAVMRRRFAREVQALAGLQSNHLVTVYEYGEHEGEPYLVMNYLGGGTLKDRCKKGEPLDYRQAAALLLPVARGLEACHRQGLVHRDVKPSNILFDEQGEAHLSDFGIVRWMARDQKAEDETLTPTGAVLGTAQYMAPEQALGKPIDGRADVYALGAVYYELVCGRRPFEGDSWFEVANKQVHEPLPDPRQFAADLPPAAVALLQKAMAKDPEQRFQTMAEMGDALQALLQPAMGATTEAVAEQTESVPLAKAFQIEELPGMFEKKLDVPPLRQGVVVSPDGAVKTYPEGRQRVLALTDRLTGRSASMRIGYVPAQPFNLRLIAASMPSRDGKSLAASLSCEVEVADTGLFFTRAVLPHRQITAEGIPLSAEDSAECLGGILQTHDAEDLLRGLPPAEKADLLNNRLPALLARLGLRLRGLEGMNFWQTTQPPVQKDISVLVERLIEKSAAAAAQPSTVRVNRCWWAPRSGLIAAFVLLGCALSWTIERVYPDAAVATHWEIYIPLWTTVLGVVLQSVKSLVEKWEQVNAFQVSQPKERILQKVSQQPPRQLDGTVRTYCAGEIEQTRQVIKSLRSQAYHAGFEDLAQRLYRIEPRLEKMRLDILDEHYAMPPYANERKLSAEEWQRILEQEEQVLAQAAALREASQTLTFKGDQLPAANDRLDRFIEQMDSFIRNYNNRSRPSWVTARISSPDLLNQ